jgi:hypothetical protein
MVKTITEETYYQGSEQKTGIVFSDVNLVSFQNRDGSVVIYNEIGVIETVTDELLGDLNVNKVLTTRILKYNDEELKTLIEGTGRDFNSPITNLLISEVNSFVDDIILKDIETNPSNYFGITVDKWTK